jgi:glutamate carboxypeptidase
MRTAVAVVVSAAALLLVSNPLRAQADEKLRVLAEQERPAFMETLKTLVEIESGSRDAAGLKRVADVLEDELRKLGAAVERGPPHPAQATC